METQVSFSPILPMEFLSVLAVLVMLGIIIALWRGLSGWWLRGLAALLLLGALANPVFLREDRETLSNIVILAVDETESQSIADRPKQIETALNNIRSRVGGLDGFEIREVTIKNDSADRDAGSLVLTALAEEASKIPQSRLAGAIIVTDGRVHDAGIIEEFPAPVHVLQTGSEGDWDRRLVLSKAPAFAIVGEEIMLTLEIETNGAVPESENNLVDISIAVDGGPPQTFQVRQNTELELPVTLPHGGANVLQFNVAVGDQELTERNNSAVVSINGVRDRLRVLLVSGEPYSGGRTWRNLLKSDSSVDLVHFTILRSQDKLDGVPVRELSLIAFPTRELFLDKIHDFDLIIFDRYKQRGMLRPAYLENVVEYVRQGGAVLFAEGPDFAGVNSLYRTALQEIYPTAPTSQVIEQGYIPRVTELGDRHPVTEGLIKFAPNPALEDGTPGWGRWFRLIDAQAVRGNTVMEGADGRPLLVLDRFEEGRVASLLSDHAWLWNRGFEGGGPQLELLRRLAHWMMKEPELEEEQLTAEVRGEQVFITRRSLKKGKQDITVTGPNGGEQVLSPTEISPGLWQDSFEGAENGLYRLTDGETDSVVAIGPRAPREFELAIAGSEDLLPLIDATNGGVLKLSDVADPKLRLVRADRTAAGRDWLGLVPRNAYLTLDVSQNPLLPAWAWLLGAAFLTIAAWRFEGRQ